jgi:glutamate-1-semialdehyde 2,1-aminomutase
MTQSADLFERARQLIPGGVNSPVRAFRSVGGTPFFTARADGPYLYTADGDELIDFVCTWGPAIWGHNPAPVREALKSAIENGTSFGTPGPLEVEMAEVLVGGVPSLEKVRMCNSGTEATLSAIRLARGFTGRDKIIKFAGCYHGHVDSLLVAAGSGALTLGTPDSAGIPASFARETIVVPYNDQAGVRAAFEAHGDAIAAIIVEPFPANCGLIFPVNDFLPFLREITRIHGAVLIFDEVMTGFRLGFGGVQEMTAVTPDLTAMGKIIGGGLPVGAFGGRTEIMDCLAPLGPVYQAGTLSGNPLAMAAGLASLRALQATPPYEALNAAGTYLKDELGAIAQRKGISLQIPQVGSMFALFFNPAPVTNLQEAMSSDGEAFRKVFHHALANGVYLPPSPYETCFISARHDPQIMERAVQVLADGILSL